MRRRPSLRGVVVLAAVLAGCGGADTRPQGLDPNGSAPPFDPAPGVDFNVLAAWTNFLGSSRTWTTSGIGSDGNRYTVTIATAPAASPTFPATQVATPGSDTTLAVTGAGTDTRLVRSVFFDPSGLQVIGLAQQREGEAPTCDVAVEASVPPTAARIPSSGPLAQLDQHDDCTPGSAPTGTVLFTWSLRNVAGIDLFCLNRHLLEQADPPRQHCAEVRPDGSLGDGAFVSLEFGPLTDPITIDASSN